MEAKAVHIRAPPGGDEQMAAGDTLLGGLVTCLVACLVTCLAANDGGHFSVRRLDANDRRAGAQRNALASECIQHDPRTFRILAHKGLPAFEHRYRAAQAAEGLGKFEPNRTCADDNEMRGARGELENSRW